MFYPQIYDFPRNTQYYIGVSLNIPTFLLWEKGQDGILNILRKGYSLLTPNYQSPLQNLQKSMYFRK